MDIKSSTAAQNGIQVTTAGTRGATGASGAAGVKGVGPGTVPAAAAGGREDEVQLSTLGAAIEGLQPGSAAREAKVNALREAVASGTYKVDGQAVAQSLIDDSSTD